MTLTAWIMLAIIAFVGVPLLVGFMSRPPGQPHDDEKEEP